MHMKLHANATTTPKTRAYIQKSTASVSELVRELGVSERTVSRWKARDHVMDRSHRPHRITTTMTLVEETLAVELRTALALPLDDIVEVLRRCVNPKLSRSQTHRCLKRHGVSAKPKVIKPAAGSFEAASIGFIHIDLKHLTRLQGKASYVFVAIDRATRFVHVEIVLKRDAATIAACLERFIKAFPHKVHTIVTDNGSEFTDRFGAARWTKNPKATGRHAFDRICAQRGIQHRLIRPFHPQTNGMVERFNRRIAEAIAHRPGIANNNGKNKFNSHADRNAFLLEFVKRYNWTRLKCTGYQAPASLLDNPPGQNTYAGMTAKRITCVL